MAPTMPVQLGFKMKRLSHHERSEMNRNNAPLDIRPQSIPDAGDPWEKIIHFMATNSQKIQGYEYARAYGGHEAFVADWEERFKRDGSLPDNLHALLSLVTLICRRHALCEIFTDIDVYRPIVDACLGKAHKLTQ